MKKTTEEKGLKVLKEIEAEVSELTDKTATPKRAFFMGVMQGIGVVVGSTLAVVFLGWILSISGLIPGLSDVVNYLRELSNNVR